MKFNVEAINLEGLNKHIEYVNKMLNMKEDEKFQKFIQEKVLELAKKVTDERLTGGTTNDEEINLYKSSHHIQEEADGFILYNDAKIDAYTAFHINNHSFVSISTSHINIWSV